MRYRHEERVSPSRETEGEGRNEEISFIKFAVWGALFIQAACATGHNHAANVILNIQPLLETPRWYETVWDRMEQCAEPWARKEAHFDSIRFFQADTIVRAHDQKTLFGLWSPPHVIVFDKDEIDNPYLVAHEFGHELFGVWYPHESKEFERCEEVAIWLKTQSYLGFLTHYPE